MEKTASSHCKIFYFYAHKNIVTLYKLYKTYCCILYTSVRITETDLVHHFNIVVVVVVRGLSSQLYRHSVLESIDDRSAVDLSQSVVQREAVFGREVVVKCLLLFLSLQIVGLTTKCECLEGVTILLLLEVHMDLASLNVEPITKQILGSGYNQVGLAQVLLYVITRNLVKRHLDVFVTWATLLFDKIVLSTILCRTLSYAATAHYATYGGGRRDYFFPFLRRRPPSWRRGWLFVLLFLLFVDGGAFVFLFLIPFVIISGVRISFVRLPPVAVRINWEVPRISDDPRICIVVHFQCLLLG